LRRGSPGHSTQPGSPVVILPKDDHPRAALSSAWQNRDAPALLRGLGFRETTLEMAREL